MIPDNLIHIENGRIFINEDNIDIFDYPKGNIPLCNITKQKLKPYDELGIVYLDIETFSSYRQQLDYFTDRLMLGYVLYSEIYIVEKLETYLGKSSHLEYLKNCYKIQKIEKNSDELKQLIEYLYDHESDILDIYNKPAVYPETGQIALIGIMNEKGKHIIINCLEDEAGGLKQFFKILEKKKPDILAQFNGFSFDLPFIIKRCELLGVRHPFWVNYERPTCFTTAIRFAKPAIYNSIYLKYGDRKCTIIDLYHQALAWDFVNHKLTKYSLKQVPLQLKLRKESRLELTADEMFACCRNGDISKLEEYLVYDLEDTQLLGNYLIPPLYYQQEYVKWNLQSISTGGMGSKWDSMIQEAHKNAGDILPNPDEKLLYEGGLVGSIAGFYTKVSKVDFRSMYPHNMLIYQIHSYKDTGMLQLAILAKLLSERLDLKDQLGDVNIPSSEKYFINHRQNSLKIQINSGYGVLATMNKKYNDYIAAANVTAYGRALLKYVIKLIKEMGGFPVSWDTDGVYFTTGSFEKNRDIWEKINTMLPNNGTYQHKLDYELECDVFYTPPVMKKSEYVQIVNNDDEDMSVYYQGLRKSYIIVDKKGELKVKGKFVKRNATGLEKEFIPNMCREYLTGNHEKYADEIIKKLTDKSYPTDKLSVTRKIAANEKRLVELGIGRIGDEVTIWKGKDKIRYGKRGGILKKGDPVWVDNPENIDWMFYISEVKKWIKEFADMVNFR